MFALLAVLLAALPPPPTHAVFWDPHGRTWLVDVQAASLAVAEGWLVPDRKGVRRDRRRVHARGGRDSARLPAPPSRWTTLETHWLGERRWRALTPTPDLPAPGEAQLEDEWQVIQHRGDTLNLLRARRVTFAGAPTRRFEAATLLMPEGKRAPGQGEPARGPCSAVPVGWLDLDGPGGSRMPWAVTTGDEPECDAVAQAHPAGPWAPVPRTGLPWDDLVDARVYGALAVVLRGAKLPAAVTDIAAGWEGPCVARTAWLVRPQRPPVPLGRVGRLDGLRWLAADDALVKAAPLWFRDPIAPCHRGLAVPAVGLSATHHCRVDEPEERPWGGPDDLSVAVDAAWERGRLNLTLHVTDDRAEAGDRVRLWLGPGRHPLRAHVGPDGVAVQGGRKARQRVGGRLKAAWQRARGGPGAQVQITIPQDLLGEPPALTVAVEDGPKDAPLVLWAVGHPIDGRQREATPLVRP